MEVFKYEIVDVGSIVNRIPEWSKSGLPFGLIKLDKSGRILEYNMTQASISGVRPEDAIGKNFFLDLAVCTQRPEFFGRFKEGVDRGMLNSVFDFTFTMNMAPTRVRVHMVLIEDSVFLMVKKLGAATDVETVARPPSAAVPVAHALPRRADSSDRSVGESPLFELKGVRAALEAGASGGNGPRLEDFSFEG